MKTIPHFAFVLLFTTMLIALLPTDAEAKIYDDTIRLHILANSDSSEDQTLKIEIRDRLLLKYGEKLKGSSSISEAEAKANEFLEEIEADTEKWITELGYNYKAKVTLTQEWYETRDYEEFSLPCGYYTSLRVIIGEGDGKNWWCVMYPPLCMEMATEASPADDGLIDYSKEEIKLIKSGKYKVKFKLLEMASQLNSTSSSSRVTGQLIVRFVSWAMV